MRACNRAVGVLVGGILALLAVYFPAHASDRPTASQIEAVLRDVLANRVSNGAHVPSQYRQADLEEFELLKLEGTTSHWYAETRLRFDFGKLPPTLSAFERKRLGHYSLVLRRDGAELKLLHFTPKASVHLLPATFVR